MYILGFLEGVRHSQAYHHHIYDVNGSFAVLQSVQAWLTVLAGLINELAMTRMSAHLLDRMVMFPDTYSLEVEPPILKYLNPKQPMVLRSGFYTTKADQSRSTISTIVLDF